MNLRSAFHFLSATVLVAGTFMSQGTAQPKKSVDYNRDVRPLLAQHCWPCHGQDKDALLKKADRRLGLTARLSECLQDSRRDPTHTNSKMLAQPIFGICQGWEDCNDFDALRADPRCPKHCA